MVINKNMSNLFQQLEYEAFRAGITPRTKESRDWFRNKARQLRRVNRNEIMKEDPVELQNRSVIGNMYMFFYDPKHKDTLPYYDGFPLVIVIDCQARLSDSGLCVRDLMSSVKWVAVCVCAIASDCDHNPRPLKNFILKLQSDAFFINCSGRTIHFFVELGIIFRGTDLFHQRY